MVAGILVPSLLAPSAYALVFQMRQIHTLGYFAFAFILQGAVLELSFARGRDDPDREAAIRRVALLSVLTLSGFCTCVGSALALLPRFGLSTEAAWGIIAFCAVLPFVGVSSWCNRVLLTVHRFDLLWRLVLVQMAGIACASLAGAYAYGFAGVIGGMAAGYVVATVYGLRLCRRIDAVGLELDGRLLRELAAVGLPQTVMVLLLLAARVLDRNFAYLGYGDESGGVFAVAAIFSMNLMYLTQVLAETARPTINEECAAHGRHVSGAAISGLPESIFALALGVAGTAYFALPLLYTPLFPEYVQVLATAPDLAVAALFAACPVALSYGAHMYLVATKRPRVYFIPPVLALLVMLGGNTLGLAMNVGLFGIVGVQGCANLVFAAAALGMAARHYPGLRRGCARTGLVAAFQLALTAILIRLLDSFGGWLTGYLALGEAWRAVPGGLTFAIGTMLVVVRWSRAQTGSPPEVPTSGGS